MRFLLDLSRDVDGRVAGELTSDDGTPVPFSGWLELLRLLEDSAAQAGQELTAQ